MLELKRNFIFRMSSLRGWLEHCGRMFQVEECRIGPEKLARQDGAEQLNSFRPMTINNYDTSLALYMKRHRTCCRLMIGWTFGTCASFQIVAIWLLQRGVVERPPAALIYSVMLPTLESP